MKSVALSTYINHKLRFYQYGVPLVSALAISILTAAILLLVRVTFDQTTLKDITPHISTLVETQDRPELVRLIRSIAEERKAEITLVRHGKIMASSQNLASFDREYTKPQVLFDFNGSEISGKFITSERLVLRPNGPQTETSIILSSPLLPIILRCAVCALAVLLVGFGLSYLFAFRIKEVVQTALEPIEGIGNQIRDLKNLEAAEISEETGISEFDAIQETIGETRKVLIESRDIKAIARARELTAETYQKLIHDLGTPVSALQQMITTANSAADLDDKEKAAAAIPKLAGQIVSQIKAAKENLTVDINILSAQDLRECIEDSIFQSSQEKKEDIQISKDIPDSPIVIPHDASYLRRAFSNIINNAIQACNEKVTVTMNQQHDRVIIKIEDDGPGINQSLVSEFLQGTGVSTKSDRRAYGLASANHIIKQHGGRIVSRSSSLGGACFEVHL